MDPVEQHNVAIFWDYENCEIPATAEGYTVTSGIRRIAHEYGTVTAFKAYCQTPELMSPKYSTMRSELHACGVSVIDCPHNGRKDTADKKMMVDMLAHAIDNPAPSTVILISGDGDFGYTVSILRWRRYRVIVLAPSNCTHYGLKLQANKVYEWPREILPLEPQSAGPQAAASGNRPVLSTSQPVNYYRPLPAPPNNNNNTRARSNSVQHTRSASTPTAQTSSTNLVQHFVTPRKNNNVLPEVSPGQGRPATYAEATTAVQDTVTTPTDRGQSPWRPTQPLRPAPLSPLAPAVTIDEPRDDLPSHEERTEDGDSVVAQLEHTDADDRLTPVVNGTYAYDRAPMQLPSPVDQHSDNTLQVPGPELAHIENGTHANANTSEASDIRPADTDSPEDAAGLITVQVRPDIVVPEVSMTRLAKPPTNFRPMVNVLERERLRGNTRVLFSQLGSLIRQEDPRAYVKVNCTQLKDYVAKAEQTGVVIVGTSVGPLGANGNKWTALHPIYHGRTPEQVAAATMPMASPYMMAGYPSGL